MKDSTWLLLIGLGIGGYILYKMFSAVSQPIQDAGAAIGGVIDTATTPYATIPLPPTVLTPEGSTMPSASPLDIIFPPVGIIDALKPGGFVEQGNKWVLGNIAGLATWAITGKAPTTTKKYVKPTLSANQIAVEKQNIAAATTILTSRPTVSNLVKLTPTGQVASSVKTIKFTQAADALKATAAAKIITTSPIATASQKFAAIMMQSPVNQSIGAKRVLTAILKR